MPPDWVPFRELILCCGHPKSTIDGGEVSRPQGAVDDRPSVLLGDTRGLGPVGRIPMAAVCRSASKHSVVLRRAFFLFSFCPFGMAAGKFFYICQSVVGRAREQPFAW